MVLAGLSMVIDLEKTKKLGSSERLFVENKALKLMILQLRQI